jgi:hypothetical protein
VSEEDLSLRFGGTCFGLTVGLFDFVVGLDIYKCAVATDVI